MGSGTACGLLILSASILLAGCGQKSNNEGLRVGYGPKGVEQISFNGVVLEDLKQYPSDVFHIWHIQASALDGKALTDRQYGWGEVNNSRTWELAAHAWHYSFVWGAVTTQFTQKGNNFEMSVTEKNNGSSGVTLHGVTIYPLVLHFPDLPAGFGEASYEHLAVEPGDPAPTADFGQGRVTVMADSGSKPLYRGFEPAGGGNNYFPVISSTAMDSMSASYPKLDRPLPPGATDTFTVSLRFSSSGSSQ